MPDYDPLYGDAEGPLGFPMPSQQAKQLDDVMKRLPQGDEYEYRKHILPAALDDLKPGERADISWISVETPDRDRDLVKSDGMDDTQFRLNPIVTLNHAYWLPPVGLSLWRRKAREADCQGVLAKTFYPARPDGWDKSDWPPDDCLSLVQSGLLRGKSIGFLPLKARPPSEKEVKQYPDMANVRYVIEKWLLLEYACCYLPVQQHAVVEAVGKSMVPTPSVGVCKALGITLPPPRVEPEPEADILAFEELVSYLSHVDWTAVGRQRADQLRGAV